MVSSITEGEVKEKEAVVLDATTVNPQTIPPAVRTPLVLTADHDTNNDFDGTKFTPSVAGWYHFTGTFGINGITTDFNTEMQTALIRKNNDDLYYGVQLPITSAYSISQVDATIYLNGTTDYVELLGYQASGATKNTNPGLVKPRLQAFLITGQSTGGGSDIGTTTATVDTAIGMVAPFAMDSVPTGWLHCDGSEVSRDTYSLLYSKVGDTYGNGDGSTTFNLPNLQDEFIRGSSDTLPVGNKQDDEFKEHLHEFKVSKSPVYSDTGSVGAEGGTMSGREVGGSVSNGDPNYGMKKTGGSETRPRNVAMLYCINATAEPSSGGGDYTPEKMVWEDKLAEREIDTEYTNTNDVPIYVQLFIDSKTAEALAFYIDDVNMGVTSTSGTRTYNTNLHVVPAGSRYELKQSGANASTLRSWHEARMPVAVGTGDSIWTEEDGKATYDGDVEIGGMTVNSNGSLHYIEGSESGNGYCKCR